MQWKINDYDNYGGFAGSLPGSGPAFCLTWRAIRVAAAGRRSYRKSWLIAGGTRDE
jgi:hypothetical protein